MKRINYLKPNALFFDVVNKVLGGNAYNIPAGFEDRIDSVVIKMNHYNGAGYKLIEVQKEDIEKYFALDFAGEETVKI